MGRWARSALLVGAAAAALGLSGCGGAKPADAFPDARVAALVSAAIDGDRAGIERMRDEGADIDAHGRDDVTPLIWCVAARSETGVRTLLDVGADPGLGSAGGATALHWAARLPDPAMLEILTASGVDPSTPNTVTGAGAITDALMAERAENVTFLIGEGADVDMTDRTGNTALHTAAKINQADAVLELLAAEADPTAVNAQGATFQRYLYMTPENVRSDALKRGIAEIEQELERRGIPLER